MLERTFSFLPGIGPTSERRLWRGGITTWSTFLDSPSIPGINPQRKTTCDVTLTAARTRREQDDARYFGVALPSRDHWRLYEWLRPRAVFLDIETNSFGQITVVGLYGRGRYQAYVRGESLTAVALAHALQDYDLLLTFNGSSFDLPMLIAQFPNLPLDQPHIDLCWLGRRLQYRGGLKLIESQLGIRRSPSLQGHDGSDAMVWWNRWQRRRDTAALELLLAYNEADCVNLKPLADRFYCELSAQLLQE